MKLLLFFSFLSFISFNYAEQKPLKVYILAGQSNMEGHAHLRVLDYMKGDPNTSKLYEKIKNPNGSYKLIPNTWISYLTGEKGKIDRQNREVHGQLTVGFGSQGGRDYSKPGEKIGPELAFGITVQEVYKQPILIIKTAWGGQSLHTDFRSPSSGPYPETEFNKKRFDTEEKRKTLAQKTGARYKEMIDHVKLVLKDLKRVYPDYKNQGFELAGFAWFQGWNDLVDSQTYPNRHDGDYKSYSECLANFIRDVRKDLKAPKLPFAIGVMGVGGELSSMPERNRKTHTGFRKAMAAPASMSEFKGNVFAVQTALFWDEKLAALDDKHQKVRQKSYLLRKKHKDHENAKGDLSQKEIQKIVNDYRSKIFSKEDLELEKKGKSNAGYHYLGAATTYSLIGEALAKALISK